MNGLPELVVVGAGGHGRVCADTAAAAGFRVLAFCDAASDIDGPINGIEVVAAKGIDAIAERFDPATVRLAVAIGDNETRMALLGAAEVAGFALPPLIHPSVVLSPSATIGAGSVIIANSVVNANARVGKGCILNTACAIDHDNVLEDGVQICPGVRAAGTVHFGEKAFIGTGAIIVPGVRIGREAYIAAGALIVRDVADGERIGRNS